MAEGIDTVNKEACTDDKRQQFGNRILTDPRNVFEHNAWDNVVWDEAQELEAKTKTNEQMEHMASQEDQKRFEEEADAFWNDFYGKHENKFFKDRQWLFTEFPELAPESYLKNADNRSCDKVTPIAKDGVCTKCSEAKNKTMNGDKSVENDDNLKRLVAETSEENCEVRVVPGSSDCPNIDGQASDCVNIDFASTETFPGESAHFRIFEVGCGVGNTVFPILQANNDPELMVYCCDFSKTAIDLVKENKDYSRKRCHAFVCDISDPASLVPVPNNSLDIIILIFVLSAINPEKFQAVLNRLAGLLKPGGTILFRDYGRYDMAQLRFKKGRCLSENFYARGDGTRVYFFTQDELRTMMTSAGLVEKQNLVDRRLQVNRGRQLKMYRVWIQCKYVKPDVNESDNTKQVNSYQDIP